MAAHTLYGMWKHNQQRYAELFDVPGPREAERAAQEATSGGIAVCSVLLGAVRTVDTYTLYVDPEDQRNIGAQGIELDEQQLEITEFTVMGFIRERGDTAWNRQHIGQRYCKTVEAFSGRAAEDVARSYALDEKDHLWVCATVLGTYNRADWYAKFADPNTQVA